MPLIFTTDVEIQSVRRSSVKMAPDAEGQSTDAEVLKSKLPIDPRIKVL